MINNNWMKKLGAVAFLCSASLAESQTWWSNGDSVTHVGIGYQGNDISSYDVDPLARFFGLAAGYNQENGPFALADDYVVGEADVIVSRIRIRCYQAGTPLVVSRVHLNIYLGDPLTEAELVYSDSESSSVESSMDYINPETGHLLFRMSSSVGSSALSGTRKQHVATVRIGSGLVLSSHQQYFFSWSLEGTTTRAFTPTLPRRGNGRQSLNGTWETAKSDTFNPASVADLPFELETTPVPEPATFVAIGFAGLAFILRRRSQ